MTFELLPTIDIMIDLYEKPRTIERFQEYLKTLQGGTKGDLVIPIGGFNPMAKEHAVNKLKELKELDTEKIIQETLSAINKNSNSIAKTESFKVALNLLDDLKGGWTNRYTSDYDSKFKLNALVNRKFCIPIFWTSETLSASLIKERTQEYVFRTIYWLDHPKPKTLKQHFDQERFVAENISHANKPLAIDVAVIKEFFNVNQGSENYHLIFNFFYGDGASKSLEFPMYGIKDEMAGFEYAKYVISKR